MTTPVRESLTYADGKSNPGQLLGRQPFYH